MEIGEIIKLALEALKERRTRSVLTIMMVIVGSGLMVSLNGMNAGFVQFMEKQFSSLAPNVIFVSSAPRLPGTGLGFGGGGSTPKIVLTPVVVSNIKNLPSVEDAIPRFVGQITLESRGKAATVRVMAMDLPKIFAWCRMQSLTMVPT